MKVSSALLVALCLVAVFVSVQAGNNNVDTIRKHIDELENETAELRAKLQTLLKPTSKSQREEVAELKQTVKTKRAELDGLRKQRTEAREARAALAAQRAKTNSDLASLRARRNNINTWIEDAQKKIDQLKKSIAELKRMGEAKIVEYETMQTALATTKQKLAKTKEGIVKLKTKLKQVEGNIEKQKKTLAETTTVETLLKGQHTSAQNHLQKAETKKDKKVEQRKNKREALKKLREEREANKEAIEKLVEKKLAETETRTKAAGKVKKVEGRIAKTRSDRKVTRETSDRVKEEVQAYKAEIFKLTHEHTKADKKAVRELRAVLATKRSEATTVKGLVDKYSAHVRTFRRLVSTANKARQINVALVAALRQVVNTLKGQRADHISTLNEHKQALAEAKEKVSKLREARTTMLDNITAGCKKAIEECKEADTNKAKTECFTSVKAVCARFIVNVNPNVDPNDLKPGDKNVVEPGK